MVEKTVISGNIGRDFVGVPTWRCSFCHKRFQTKAIAATHETRKHGGN